HTPQGPMLRSRDRGTRVPELGRDTAVARVLQHAHALAVAHLPPDLAAELEVVTLVVDRPAPVGLHVDAVRGVEYLFERLPPGFEADIRHADQRQTSPPVGAHASVRARLANGGGCLARGHVAREPAVSNDVGGLSWYAFVVKGEGSESWAVPGACVADN